MIYLASIPRSGSTLLASLLGQREDTFVSKTSNLGNIMGAVIRGFTESSETQASGADREDLYKTLRAVHGSHYSDKSEPVIIDKGRHWPNPVIMETMKATTGELPKIIATVRPPVECAASIYKIEGGGDKQRWVKESKLLHHMKESYGNLRSGYEKYPDNFLLIEYDNLCNHTQRELDRVADFIGVPHVTFDPSIQQVGEDDNVWGIEDLHTLGEKIGISTLDAREVLEYELFHCFDGGEFWNDKPEPDRGKEPLDLALAAGLIGEFDKSESILRNFAKEVDSDRTRFNLGFHEMRRGNLLRGHKYLEYGRNEGVFGGEVRYSGRPLWKGERNSTVLLHLEGGLGDMIHCSRYAKEIASYGNTVIAGGASELAEVLSEVEGVSAYCEKEAIGGVYHDYLVQGMSAPIPLDMEWSDVKGTPYIKRDGESQGRIGIKWFGNPEYEHQLHRLFPEEMMFDVVSDRKDQCISLQKDGEHPDWLERPSLETWSDTRKVISSCDLVITSCTSVAHMAGAIGIETWIVNPILPYYLWALPGNKTPHYNSMKLFNQTEYGCWEVPFKQIRKHLRGREICQITA